MTVPTTSIDINRIVRDADLQIRQEFDADTVAEYIANVDQLPPVVVFFDGERYWLADGWHRLDAHKGAGKSHINCRIHEGSKLDALKYALGANRTHGLKRKPADVRKAVRVAMLTADLQANSSRLVAELVGISHHHANNLMQEIRRELNLDRPEEVITRTGGTCALPKRTDVDDDPAPESNPRPPRTNAAPVNAKAAAQPTPEQAPPAEVQTLPDPEPAAMIDPEPIPTPPADLPWEPPLYDGCKVKIEGDPHMEDVFRTTRTFVRKFTYLHQQLASLLNEFSNTEAGMFFAKIAMSQNKETGEWRNINLDSLAGGMPFNLAFVAYCPTCEGKGGRMCKTCQGIGWLTMAQFKRLDPELQQKAINRANTKRDA